MTGTFRDMLQHTDERRLSKFMIFFCLKRKKSHDFSLHLGHPSPYNSRTPSLLKMYRAQKKMPIEIFVQNLFLIRSIEYVHHHICTTTGSKHTKNCRNMNISNCSSAEKRRNKYFGSNTHGTSIQARRS